MAFPEWFLFIGKGGVLYVVSDYSSVFVVDYVLIVHYVVPMLVGFPEMILHTFFRKVLSLIEGAIQLHSFIEEYSGTVRKLTEQEPTVETHHRRQNLSLATSLDLKLSVVQTINLRLSTRR